MPFVRGQWREGHGQSRGREGPAPFTAMGGARPDLDLTEYVAALGGDAAQYISAGFVRPKKAAPALDTRELADRAGTQQDLSRPLLFGKGPVEASTCRALDRTDRAIWDVNGYYRRLGFSWPFTPSRKELLAAFRAHGNEPGVEVTFAFKQLWHPVVRAAYDRSPLGEPFYDDQVSDALKRKAKLEAMRRSAREGREVEAAEVLDDWGLVVDEEPEPTPVKSKVGGPTSASVVREVPWSWSYYLWRSTAYGGARLDVWQQFLIEQFAILGIHTKFSVGYFGKQPQRWFSVQVGQRTVILLNEGEEPTTELARDAVLFVRQGLLDQ